MRRPSGGRPMMDPVIFEGPPKPEEMTSIATLDQGQQQHYSTLYNNFMAETKQDRDSLAALRQARRASATAAPGEEGSGPGRRGMPEAQGIRSDLEERQHGFDAALKDFFSKEQFRRYEGWCDQKRKDFRGRMRDGRPGGPPDGPPS